VGVADVTTDQVMEVVACLLGIAACVALLFEDIGT
jgi:hypothetical protein